MPSLFCPTKDVHAATPLSPTAWVTTWAAAQTAPYGGETISSTALEGATVREVVHVSAGGKALRLRVSNLFGAETLVLRSVHVALAGNDRRSSRIVPSTDRVLSFGGSSRVSLPAGAEFLSDSLPFSVQPLSDLAVTLVIEHAPAAVTLHAGARATTFFASGDHAADLDLPAPSTMTRWCLLTAVEVSGDTQNQGGIVAFGDSITDGHGSTTDGNDRWPDLLARRLNTGPKALDLAVANEGIGGNRLLADGVGANALARFSRDALGQTGTRTVVVLEGINDIGSLDRVTPHDDATHRAFVALLEAALQQMVTQTHAHGLRIFGGTLTPFRGSDYYHPSDRTENDRQALNAWIRTPGHFDAVIDFDQILPDPEHPDRLLPAADSGDHLHPGPDGYRRMAEAVPLALLLP